MRHKLQSLKISIITVVYNAEQFLRDCIQSVLAQDYADLEYILIDGNSTDASFEIAKAYQNEISVLISEPDKGMYDALNKGIGMATGEVIGILNADDMLADSGVITAVAKMFQEPSVEAVYGDLNYVAPHEVAKVQRKWRSAPSSPKDLALGWMPAHPTLYIRTELFKAYGPYRLNYGSAADYELMLRYCYTHEMNTRYLPLLMVNMRNGGMSNQSTAHRYRALLSDYSALKHNKIPFPLLVLALKKMRKVKQFF